MLSLDVVGHRGVATVGLHAQNQLNRFFVLVRNKEAEFHIVLVGWFQVFKSALALIEAKMQEARSS